MKLILYNVSDNYVDYLREFDKKVLSTKEDGRTHERKYLGIVLNVNNFKYFVPLSSPKNTDYQIINGLKVIRKSIVPIMRIVIAGEPEGQELKGTLKFSSMIPVPDSEITEYDLYNESDVHYKDLVAKEFDFIRKNNDKILKSAKTIYNQKVKNFDFRYLESTVDFKLLEKKCEEYS